MEGKDSLSSRGIWIERTTGESMGINKGDEVQISLPNKKGKTNFSMEGMVSDPSRIPAKYSGLAYGFINEAAAERLGIPPFHNLVQIKLDGSVPEGKKARMAGEIRRMLEDNGITVYRNETSSETFFIRDSVINSLLNVFILLGAFSIVLGFVLIVHLFHRIIVEDRFSLSVQKAVGASSLQLWQQYIVLIGVLGLLLSALSIPASMMASRYLVFFLGRELNLGLDHPEGISSWVAGILLFLSFSLPLAGASGPIRKLVESPIIEGFKSTLSAPGRKGKYHSRFFHLSLLSWRNAFLKKVQVLMNIIMLSFGGGIIIACLTLNQSLQFLLEDLNHFWKHDVEWSINSPQPKGELISLAMGMDGVKGVEGWTKRNAEVIRSASGKMNALFYSMPADSRFINPYLIEGSWLDGGHPNDIVINSELSESLGSVNPGDKLELQIGKSNKEWRVAGIIASTLSGPSVYMVQGAYGEWLDQYTVNRLMVDGRRGHQDSSLLQEGEEYLGEKGVQVVGSDTVSDMNARQKEILSLVIVTILLVGILFALAGMVNLMIAVSINVFERMGEIGILRSLGCSNWKIYQLFIWESTLIALLSWGLATAMSYPLNWLLGWKIGESLLHSSMEPGISAEGSVYWLCASIFIGLIATILPVKKALGVNVKELL